MKIQYLGHSCFKLTESTGTTVITDPYGGIGYELPKGLKADAVTVSHDHFDHNNVKAIGGRLKSAAEINLVSSFPAWRSRASKATTTTKAADKGAKTSFTNLLWMGLKYAIWEIWARNVRPSF